MDIQSLRAKWIDLENLLDGFLSIRKQWYTCTIYILLEKRQET